MKRERGQIYILFAISVTALIVFAALAFDVGYYRYAQRLQQTAADSAAIAAAQASVFPSPNAYAAAVADAATNGFAAPVSIVTVDTAYADAYTSGSAAAVKVNVVQTYPQVFGGILGKRTWQIGSSAVAVLEYAGNQCLASLGTGGSSFHGFNGSACSIVDNGNPTFKGAVDAAGISYAGSASAAGNPSFANAEPRRGMPAPDPCPYISGCAELTANPPIVGACAGTAAADAVLSPGCYDGQTFQDDILSPGLYVIKNGATFKGTISATSVTFYVISGGVTFDGAGSYSLSAPAGPSRYAGMLFYQPASNTAAADLNGARLTAVGSWYLPGADVTFNGSKDSFTGDLIAKSFTFRGNVQHDFSPGTNTPAAPKIARLAE